jgi:DNA-binding Lrp family transcriptional regulator
MNKDHWEIRNNVIVVVQQHSLNYLKRIYANRGIHMVSAVVLVNTELGSSQDKVMESLRNIEGVEEAHALYGVYDLIIKIKALTLDKLKEIIKLRIRQTSGVTSSLTLMIIEH